MPQVGLEHAAALSVDSDAHRHAKGLGAEWGRSTPPLLAPPCTHSDRVPFCRGLSPNDTPTTPKERQCAGTQTRTFPVQLDCPWPKSHLRCRGRLEQVTVPPPATGTVHNTFKAPRGGYSRAIAFSNCECPIPVQSLPPPLPYAHCGLVHTPSAERLHGNGGGDGMGCDL